MTASGAPALRPARKDDADHLVAFVEDAGEGIAGVLWSAMAGPGESAADVGRSRARRDEGGFSYRNACIAELSGRVAGGLIGYPLPPAPAPLDPDMPAFLLPMHQLENLVPGSWYVNVLAVYPRFRRRGVARALLHRARDLARAAGCARLSIVVFDHNAAALALYRDQGYRELARRPLVKTGSWTAPGEAAILLVMDV